MSNTLHDAQPSKAAGSPNPQEVLRRWRMVLGGEADGTGCPLTGADAAMDQALLALYGTSKSSGAGNGGGGAGSGASSLNVPRWLGDIRQYFPSTVVQVMQQDAIERLDLKRLMLEPEMLQSLTPDVNLVATLLSLSHLLPSKTRDTARMWWTSCWPKSANPCAVQSAALSTAALAPVARATPISTGTARSALI
jgi:hypothetical protein